MIPYEPVSCNYWSYLDVLSHKQQRCATTWHKVSLCVRFDCGTWMANANVVVWCSMETKTSPSTQTPKASKRMQIRLRVFQSQHMSCVTKWRWAHTPTWSPRKGQRFNIVVTSFWSCSFVGRWNPFQFQSNGTASHLFLRQTSIRNPWPSSISLGLLNRKS